MFVWDGRYFDFVSEVGVLKVQSRDAIYHVFTPHNPSNFASLQSSKQVCLVPSDDSRSLYTLISAIEPNR
jgi:hypothetical protein